MPRADTATSSLLFVLSLLLLLGACSSMQRAPSVNLEANAQWLLLPWINESGDSLAAANAQAMVESHLRSRGVKRITTEHAVQQAVRKLEPAGIGQLQYAVSGTISRWGYDVETGRSPEVLLEIQIHNNQDGTILFEDRLLRKRRGSASLTEVADSTVKQLLAGINVDSSPPTKDAVEAVSANQRPPSGEQSLPPPLSTAMKTSNRTGSEQWLQDMGSLAGKSTAIFYAANPPVNLLAQFDRLVLEPDNIRPVELNEFNRRGVETYAYLSIGEVGPHRDYAKWINPGWVVGGNTAWNSQVMDLSSAGWQQFLLSRVDKLVSQGYDGLFLDTLDSYQIAAETPQQQQQQEAALVSLLARFKQRHPDLKLIANRGFEIVDRAAEFLEAVAAESLYASWDNAAQVYTEVSPADHQWLLSKLSEIQERHKLDIIAIDYLPPERREEARVVAKKIAEYGFIPWLSTPGFDSMGVGLLEVIPREILLLYDREITGYLSESEVYTQVATPLEYMGYVPVYLDISSDPLPQELLKGRYAGVVSWLNPNIKQSSQQKQNSLKELSAWYQKQLRAGVPIAFMGNLLLSHEPALLAEMGIAFGARLEEKTAAVTQQSAMLEFEAQLLPKLKPLPAYPRSVGMGNEVHLQYSDRQGRVVDLVVTAAWGGYAVHPAVIDMRMDEDPYWILNPFEFLQKALQLEPIPQPDVTTENGRRLWFAHIDGDALPSFAEMPGRKLGAEVIEERILNRFQLPHTISIVEGEMNGVLAYGDRRERMYAVARRIFAREEVELASHSFSHPYKWRQVGPNVKAGKYNLPIPGYQYSAAREVAGSVQFINEELAPPGKRVKVMLWTGDASPSEEALEIAQTNGLLNMNGGDTYITNSLPTLRFVYPMALPVGKQIQVTAPIMNENRYTNDWLGPYDGFRRVIESFKLTDSPRRMKPMNIYYHFYSGTKIAAIKALEEVYEWTLTQDIVPVLASYYIQKVDDFRQAGVARALDGSWKVSALGDIRTLRVLDQERWPNISSGNGVIGAKRLHDGVYIHTNGADTASFELSRHRPSDFHLVSSNALVNYWNVMGNQIQFRLKGALPVEMELGGAVNTLCQVKFGNGRVRGIPTPDGTLVFSFSTLDTGNATLECGT